MERNQGDERMSEYAPTTDEVLRERLEALEMPLPNGHQFLRLGKSGADILLPIIAEIRIATLEEAATLLEFPIGIQVTNGVGWVPTDSRAGAARYLRHLARDAGTP